MLNQAVMLAKARSKAELRVWLNAGARFEVWGWAQRAGRWQVKRVAVRAKDLAGVIVETPPRRPRAAKQPTLFDNWPLWFAS
jgi:hypothetical protein